MSAGEIPIKNGAGQSDVARGWPVVRVVCGLRNHGRPGLYEPRIASPAAAFREADAVRIHVLGAPHPPGGRARPPGSPSESSPAARMNPSESALFHVKQRCTAHAAANHRRRLASAPMLVTSQAWRGGAFGGLSAAHFGETDACAVPLGRSGRLAGSGPLRVFAGAGVGAAWCTRTGYLIVAYQLFAQTQYHGTEGLSEVHQRTRIEGHENP